MHRVLEGQNHFLTRPLGWLERVVYRLGGVDGKEQTWQRYAGGSWPSARSRCSSPTRSSDFRRGCLEPQGFGPVEAARLQHRRELHHEHELAGLRRRSDHELPEPDAGLAWHNFISAAVGIAVAVAWHAVSHVAVRARAPARSAISGWTSRGHRLHPAAGLPRVRPGLRLQDDPKPLRLRAGHDSRRRPADDSDGPVASQEAIKQLARRRRLHERQRRSPFENPNPLTNFFSMFLIFAIRRASPSRSAAWRGTSARVGCCSPPCPSCSLRA